MEQKKRLARLTNLYEYACGFYVCVRVCVYVSGRFLLDASGVGTLLGKEQVKR